MIVSQRRIHTSLLFLFFFGSGFAALLYQIVWLKYLNLLFGSTTYATAAVLSAFLFGLSLGSRMSPKWPRLLRNPLGSYGLVEIGVGIFAIFFPFFYAALKTPFGLMFQIVGPEHFLYNLLGFLFAFFVLVIPTALMGASLPLLSHYMIHEEKLARKTGYLYAINTAGAVAGILVTAFILIPHLGLHATISAGVVINLAVGLICFLSGKESEENGLLVAEEGEHLNTRDLLLFLYAVSGMVAIAYEVLWTRILVLHMGSSVYAYAVMLSVFLVGISAGSAFSGRFIVDRYSSLTKVFGLLQIAWAFAILFQAFQFAHFQDSLYATAKIFSKVTPWNQFLIFFICGFQVIALPTFLSGALFPLVVKHLSAKGFSIEHSVGISYAYNTVGGIFGSIVAGFVLIPLIGTQSALLVLAAINLILGFAASPRLSYMVPAALVFVGGVFLISDHLHILESAGIFQMGKREQLIHLEEDAAATISVETRDENEEVYRSLSVNGVNVAGTAADLVAIQKLQAHIPMMLAGTTLPKRVLHIGFGSGGTAYSVSLYPQTQITVVELSHAIVHNADTYFRAVNHGVVHSPKVNFIFFDGRSYLQNTRENYDAILSDSIHPKYSGNGSLYTRDYYQLVSARLNPGGVHSQWLPLYSLTTKNLLEIFRAFHDVFPETYVWYINSTINPFVILTGKKDGRGISVASIAAAFQIQSIRDDLRVIHVPNPYFILDYFLMGKRGLGVLLKDAEPHVDDRMSVEYESSLVLDRQGSYLANFRQLLQFREGIIPYLDRSMPVDAALYRRFVEATTRNLEGQVYLLAKDPAHAQALFGEAHRLNPADPDPYVPALSH